MQQERREKEKRRPRDTTFVALRPEFVKLGKLMDISSSGLCFEYIAKGIVAPVPDALQVDLFINGNGYYLPKVPCRLAYDIKTEREMTFTIGLEYRRCGLQFARLSEKQMDQLEFYLTHHTTEAG